MEKEQHSAFVERTVAATVQHRKELGHDNRFFLFQPDSNPCNHSTQGASTQYDYFEYLWLFKYLYEQSALKHLYWLTLFLDQ